jgi:radical SAM superfamily enzyme YgiQ (UPF0313 family)
MKILLVNPGGPNYRFRKKALVRSISYPALSLTTLAALVPSELGADVRIYDESVDGAPVDFNVDVLGITVLTAAANRAYQIADNARRRGVHVVLGGCHASCCADEAQTHADTLITGWAEETWPQFLRDFAAGRPQRRYAQTGPLCLAGRPRPRRDLLNAGKYMDVAVVMASRGCAHHCRFCAVSHDAGYIRSQRPVADVIEEISLLRKPKVLFLDPCFHADPEYALELMAALEILRIRWGCLTTVNTAARPELLEAMRRSGCIGVLTGFESLCQATLDAMGKRHNQPALYLDAVRRFHHHGLSVFGCFVFGFEEDGPGVFARTIDFIDQGGLDLVHFTVLTPFPGTPLFQAYHNSQRIITSNYDLYDFQHVVFQPGRMSPRELQLGLRWAWRTAYTLPRIARRIRNTEAGKLLTLIANIAFSRFHKRVLS